MREGREITEQKLSMQAKGTDRVILCAFLHSIPVFPVNLKTDVQSSQGKRVYVVFHSCYGDIWYINYVPMQSTTLARI